MTENQEQQPNGDIWLNLFMIVGGGWLLHRLLYPPRRQGITGIGVTERQLIAYQDSEGRKVFLEELRGFDHKECTDIIGAIIKARKSEHLQYPFFKTLKGTPITAELRPMPFRIMLHQLNERDFLMLSVFKKTTNETPPQEIKKAEARLKEFRSQVQNKTLR